MALIHAGAVDSSTVRDFRARSKGTRAITLAQSQRAGFTLLPDGERQYLNSEARWIDYGREEQGSDPFWKGIAAVHPGVRAILSFALPGFNRTRDEAVVDVTTEKADGGAARETIIVRKTGTTWAIAKRHVESEPVSGRIAGGRCESALAASNPTLSQLSSINGDYIFTLISDTGDGEAFDWRARFSPDTSALGNIDLSRVSPAQLDLVVKQLQAAFEKRDHSIPIFEVLDAKSGERRKYADAGNYVESAGRRFSSKSGLMQMDGSGYVIDIRTVEKDAIFGMWSAFSFGVRVDGDGFVTPDPAGHFCARKIR